MRDRTSSETIEVAADAGNLLRVRYTAMAGAIAFLAALCVDYFLTPEHLPALVAVRGVVCATLTSVGMATRQARFAARAPELSLAGLLFCGTGLIACAIVSRADTGYNASLGLVFLAIAVTVPLRLASGCIAMGSLTVAYAMSMVAFQLEPSQSALLNKVFWLLLSGGLAGICLYTKSVLRHQERGAVRREREARLLLRNSNAALQSTVAKLNLANLQLTQRDSAKNQFFASVNHASRTPLMLILEAAHSSDMSLRIAASGLAHDILNPVGFIKSASFLIAKYHRTLVDPSASPEKRAAASDKLLAALQSANAGVERVESAVQQLRKVAEGVGGSEPEPLDINTIIQRTLVVTAETVTVKTALAARSRALLRPGQFDRVLLNLLLNALEAGGSHCQVEVASADSADGKFVQVAIKDNGPGMDSDTLSRVAEPYFSTKRRGSGLGLAMCKQIIAEHGGHMVITSKLGVGTTFAIDLPSAPLASPAV